MNKRLTVIAMIAVCTVGLSLTGCKSGDKDKSGDTNTSETDTGN